MSATNGNVETYNVPLAFNYPPTAPADSSASLDKLASALAKAQACIKGAVKDSSNPFFKSNYADLESVWSACREALTSNGLSILQRPFRSGADVGVATRLLHESGQWIESSISVCLPENKRDSQSIGSVLSYLRRYSLAAMAGVYQTDDDAEAAYNRQPVTAYKAPAPRPAPVAVTPAPVASPEVATAPVKRGPGRPRKEPEQASLIADVDPELAARSVPWVEKLRAATTAAELSAVAVEIGDALHPNDPLREILSPHYSARKEQVK